MTAEPNDEEKRKPTSAGDRLAVASVERDSGRYTAFCLVGGPEEAAFREKYKEYALRVMTLREIRKVIDDPSQWR